MRKLTRLGSTWLVALMASLQAQDGVAATIQWGAPTGISGDADVDTSGTLVRAFNPGGLAATVNGVAFEVFPVGAQINSVGNFTLSVPSNTVSDLGGLAAAQVPFANLSADYRELLGNAATSFPSLTLTLTVDGLTIGKTYLVQFWKNDSRDFNPPGFTFSVDIQPGGISLDPNTSVVEGGVGQYVIGTFLATSNSESFTFENSEVGGSLNAFQLRQVDLSPPRTLPASSMLGLGILCLSMLLVAANTRLSKPVA